MLVSKAKIVGELGGSSLLLPNQIAQALAANARIKFALSWLQAAEAAANGESVPGTLETERALAGLAGDPLYGPAHAVMGRDNSIFVSGGSKILARMFDDLACMRTAVEAGAAAGHLNSSLITQFRRRGQVFHDRAMLRDDVIPSGLISSLAASKRSSQDSFHALVIDLHKALNTIAAAISEEDVGGARVFRLRDSDRRRVLAFMRGVNRTAGLKFDHPGLATTATSDGERLIIQNDIGITDTHVLIAYVNNLELSVVYSDIHARRVEFFCRRLDEFSWTVTNRRAQGTSDDLFYLATGVLNASDVEVLDRALDHLGATLVFLIDWNKARKSLRQLTSKTLAIELLDWAAEHEVGHRAFLEIGGDALIVDLLGSVSKATGTFYPSLKSAIGEDGAADFLRQALQLASDALKSGRSTQAVHELLRIELLGRLVSISDRILDLALDHAALTLDLGSLVRGALFDMQHLAASYAGRGSEWESKADHFVASIRDLAGDGNERAWCAIASAADDAADAFEEALFKLCFLPDQIAQNLREALCRLAENVVIAVKEYVRLLAAARHIHRGAPREDLRAFFDLLERQHDMEHATDKGEREVFSIVMTGNSDARILIVATSVAEALEKASDSLLRSSRLVVDHALGGWLAP